MHIAYSAISTSNDNKQSKMGGPVDEQLLRYQAYKTACNKYSKEIAAIQKYLPGWAPKFR
jgi:hypothetical protein